MKEVPLEYKSSTLLHKWLYEKEQCNKELLFGWLYKKDKGNKTQEVIKKRETEKPIYRAKYKHSETHLFTQLKSVVYQSKLQTLAGNV